MSKLKNIKIEFKQLLTVVSAIGMVAGFIAALFSKKKATACVAFFASFAGLVAGLGMQEGLIPTPECCKKIEVDIGDDDDDWDWDDEEFRYHCDDEPEEETEEEAPKEEPEE